jgi:hypothetical protein
LVVCFNLKPDIYERVGVTSIEEKHIRIIRRPENVKRCRGRPTLTWTEAVKRDLKKWNIDKELAVDRKGWKCAIHVPEP